VTVIKTFECLSTYMAKLWFLFTRNAKSVWDEEARSVNKS
jgi:hypothetical protein